MLEIDGSAGGGQLLRSSLALSTLTDTPVRVVDVRGNRSNPGLKAQHVAAARAIDRIANAETNGVELGSDTVEFDPGDVSGGEYAVTVDTAGSLTLVFETVLPLALATDEPIRLRATGGTDVAWSPPLDYLQRVKLPFLRRHGIVAAIASERRGFYPVGGGAATLTLGPSAPEPIEATASPAVAKARVYAVASDDLADGDVAERLARTGTEMVAALDHGLESPERVVEYADADCTGAAIVLRADAETGGDSPAATAPIAGFSALGGPDRSAEAVAGDAVDDFAAWLDTGAVVDRHLADQLVVPLAVRGGTVAIPEVTDHVASSLDLVEEFGVAVDCKQKDGRAILQAEGADLAGLE
ncbi:MAG: RNA 3'-terminal phosphate cyclase [Halopenitus sp.]